MVPGSRPRIRRCALQGGREHEGGQRLGGCVAWDLASGLLAVELIAGREPATGGGEAASVAILDPQAPEVRGCSGGAQACLLCVGRLRLVLHNLCIRERAVLAGKVLAPADPCGPGQLSAGRRPCLAVPLSARLHTYAHSRFPLCCAAPAGSLCGACAAWPRHVIR